MTQKRDDLRVRRTEKLLQEALIDLVAERGFEAISVGNIAERAMINRSTFYRHYQDKFDLVEKMFETIVDEMRQSFGPPRLAIRDVNVENGLPHWVRLFEHIAQHARIYEAMLGPRGDPWFAARMRDHLAMQLLEREELRIQMVSGERGRDDQLVPLEVAITLVANLLLGTIAWWLETKRKYTPEQMAVWLVGFVSHGYGHLLGGASGFPDS